VKNLKDNVEVHLEVHKKYMIAQKVKNEERFERAEEKAVRAEERLGDVEMKVELIEKNQQQSRHKLTSFNAPRANDNYVGRKSEEKEIRSRR
jgi:selenocysteine lyase/cysteine desulfurase